ncbi:MAG TPA: hypothetical protein VF129_11080 [Actinomycetota bacterium]
MLGEQEAEVREVRRFEIHGSPFADVTVVYPDQRIQTARLGAESIPEDLEAGDRVLVSSAANMIVAIRRP